MSESDLRAFIHSFAPVARIEAHRTACRQFGSNGRLRQTREFAQYKQVVSDLDGASPLNGYRALLLERADHLLTILEFCAASITNPQKGGLARARAYGEILRRRFQEMERLVPENPAKAAGLAADKIARTVRAQLIADGVPEEDIERQVAREAGTEGANERAWYRSKRKKTD